MSDDLCACGTNPQCACTEPLFPADNNDRRCKHCGTTKHNLCKHDADLEHGLVNRTRRRPKSCLNNR